MASRRDVLRAVAAWLHTSVRASPALTLFSLALVIAQACAGPIGTYGVKVAVNGLAENDPGAITAGGAVLLTSFGAFFAALAVGNSVSGNLDDRVDGLIHRELLALGTGIPGIEHHESPAIADRIALIRKSTRELAGGSWTLISSAATVCGTGAVLVLLASVHPLLLVLPLFGIGRIWAAGFSSRLVHDAQERTAKQGRLVEWLVELASDPRHGLEVRTGGLAAGVTARLVALRAEIDREIVGATRRGAIAEASVRVGFGILYVLGIVWTIVLARRQQATVGDVALVVLLAPQVDLAAGAVAGSVRDMANMTRTFGRYVWLRDYAKARAWDDATEQPPERLEDGITFRGVGFSYPGTQKTVLRDIDLHIPSGTTVAVVGANGAGKTTLVKLLTRLYDPSTGVILVDGQDLRTFDTGAWRRQLSATFQDHVRFELTARESVGIGDLERLTDTDAIREALAAGGADAIVERLPDGLETQLGTRFPGGVDLSGGQWQRLAIARTFMRRRVELLVLDEPVSALDPEIESALLEQLTATARSANRRTGGITFLVSHRLATVRQADLIIVLDDGHVVELGDHRTLTAQDGTYAKLLRLQAANYQ